MGSRRYTEQEFRDAVRTSRTLSEALRKLGLRAAGGNFANAKRKMQRLGIDASHFVGSAWSKGERLKDWSDYTRASNLKPHLQRERGSRCEECQRTTWRNQTIPLEIHHVDGDRTNNSLDNLLLLCPNGHALTDTWRNRKPS